MRAELRGTNWVQDNDRVRGLLTCPNPEYVEALRYGAAFGIPKQIIGYHVRGDGMIAVPAGASDLTRLVPPMTVPEGLPRFEDPLMSPQPRPYQEAAIAAALRAVRGILVMPPGAGKTVTALTLVGRLRLQPLVLVHTKDLMVQWQDACVTHLGAQLRPVGGGGPAWKPRPELPIIGTVAMIQTLTTWSPYDVAQLAAEHGMLIQDECHHCPATTSFRLLWVLPGVYRYALTATPKRADGLTPLLSWAYGPILHEVRMSDLEDASVAVRARVVRVDSTFRYDLKVRLGVNLPGRGAWQRQVAGSNPDAARKVVNAGGKALFCGLSTAHAERLARECAGAGWQTEKMTDTASIAVCARELTTDPERMALVVDRALDLVASGRKTLVLAGRVEYTGALTEALIARGAAAVCLTGKLSTKVRKAGLDGLRSGQYRVAVATTLADEGLDVPDLAGMVMAFPGRSEAKTIQRVGRAMRAAPGKLPPLVYDIVDAEIGLYLNQWRARARAYRKAGCEVGK